MSQRIEKLGMARDTLIFLSQQMGFVINLQKFVFNPSQKLQVLELYINYLTRSLTLLKGKLANRKQKCKKLIQNP